MTRTSVGQGAGMLASAAAGDEIAFRRIIAEHHEDMRRVCRAIAGDDAVADEAVAAAWVVAWKKLHQVRGPTQLRPGLVAVAANEARHLLRKRRRRSELETPVDASMGTVTDETASSAAALDLYAALARLDHDDAALLGGRMARFDGAEVSTIELPAGASASDGALDTDGMPWTGSDRGPARFDGQAWQFPYEDIGIPEMSVAAVAPDGSVYGTVGAAILRLPPRPVVPAAESG